MNEFWQYVAFTAFCWWFSFMVWALFIRKDEHE